MGRFCDHEFVKIRTIVDSYAVIVCIFCGQVKHIYADGTIVIVKEQGEVKKYEPNHTDQDGSQ